MPSCKELRSIAKEMSIRGYSKMNKAQLTAAIEGSVPDSVPVQAQAEEPKGESQASEPKGESEGKLQLRVPEKEERSARKSTSKWVAFCKEYSQSNGCTYKDAMSKKDEYEVWKKDLAEKVKKLSPVSEE
jgi:hypothetical protein